MPEQRRPNSMRHPAADYSDPGMYYVALCAQGREPLFGEINNGEMRCSTFGAIVWETWKNLPVRYPDISIDAAVVMPDHFHGIIVIHEVAIRVGVIHELPLRDAENQLPIRNMNDDEPSKRFLNNRELPLRQKRRIMTIPLIIGYLKMNSAKRINAMRGTAGESVWQQGYYDRIVRIDREYAATVEYIPPIRFVGGWTRIKYIIIGGDNSSRPYGGGS